MKECKNKSNSEKQSSYYNHNFKTLASPKMEDNIRNFYFEKIKSIIKEKNVIINPETKILEIGCGSGLLMEKMQNYFKNHAMQGIDISEKNILLAKQRGLNVKVADADNLSIDDKFDIILGTAILHHVKDIKNTTDKASRLLNTNGVMLFGAEPTFYNFSYILWHKIRGDWEIEKGQLNISKKNIPEILRNNFTDIKIYTHGNFFIYSSTILGSIWNALKFSKIPSLNDIYIFARKK